MIWKTRTRTLDLSRRGLVMGVLNVTPDSFSDGGRWVDVEAAVAHGIAMAEAGAEIIDVGGESTRPGAEPVGAEEETRRVEEVVRRLKTVFTWTKCGEKAPVISIDTMKPNVAQAAVKAGAEIINDVSGLRSVEMRDVVRETGTGVIAMHMQGTPREMQTAPHYDDVCGEIRDYFRQVFDQCLGCGINTTRIAFDPGIGFGKTVAHNLAILRGLDSMRVGGRPLVLGVSRKSFLGKIIGSEKTEDSEWPTVALTAYGRSHGANVVRVHDVRPNVEALRMIEAILEP